MRSYRILKRLSREFYPLMELSRLPECREFVQHGDTTVLLHCVAVAYFSLWLVKFLHIRCNEKSLVRGALLHDYFLYDWHDPSRKREGLHGFVHPKTGEWMQFDSPLPPYFTDFLNRIRKEHRA